MRPLVVPTLVPALLLLAACGGSKPAEPAPAAAISTKAAEAKAAETTETRPATAGGADTRAPTKVLAKKSDDELRETREALRDALNEGRRLVKEGDYAGGVARYEGLLAIDPHYGPALGELGWAAFKAGDLKKAQAMTLRALKGASEERRRGMLLYNLGRIAEEKGDREAAIDAYQRSVAARPNETVQARLDALIDDAPVSAGEGDPAPAPAPAVSGDGDGDGGRGLRVMRSGLADEAALCAFAEAESLCGTSDCELVAKPAGDGGFAMLQIGDAGILECWHPVVRGADGWSIFAEPLLAQHGTEVDQGMDDLSSRLIPGAAGEGRYVVFEFKDHNYERDWSPYGLDEDEELPGEATYDQAGVIVCARGPDGPACTGRILHTHDFSSSDGKETSRYRASFAFADGAVIVDDVESAGDVDAARPWGLDEGEFFLKAGKHPLRPMMRPLRRK
ncbi:MAG: tetratricopeptide repeat protein [Myxococcales bacterium]|nr:tetratricopeptide repeat protein [Myxococcales bacterium]